MIGDALLSAVGLPLVAESAETFLKWTPETFYAVAAVAHAALVWVGYRLLGADPEYNTVTAAFTCAVLGNAVAFVGRTHGVVGFTATAIAFYGLLLVSSGIDLFRSLLIFALVLGSYGAIGAYVADNTPLDAYSIDGVPKVIMTGGFKPEPLDRTDGDAVPYLDSDEEPSYRDDSDQGSDGR